MRWLIVIIYTLCIYAFLPVSPHFWDYMKNNYPKLLNISSKATVPLGIIIVLFYLLVVLKKQKTFQYILSVLLLIGYYIVIKLYCKYPAEVFHSLEYGVIVILLYNAVKQSGRPVKIYSVVLVYSLIAGSLDEFIQFFLSSRVYETRDMAINWISSLMATSLIMLNKQGQIVIIDN